MIAAVCCAWLLEPDAEIDVGLRDAELVEEDVGHRRVVVLARVHQRGGERRRIAAQFAQRRARSS